MRPSRFLARVTMVTSAVLLAACAGRDVTAPDLAAANDARPLSPANGATREVAPGTEPIVRVGVVQSASAITLGSAADYVVRDRASGLVLGEVVALVVLGLQVPLLAYVFADTGPLALVAVAILQAPLAFALSRQS